MRSRHVVIVAAIVIAFSGLSFLCGSGVTYWWWSARAGEAKGKAAGAKGDELPKKPDGKGKGDGPKFKNNLAAASGYDSRIVFMPDYTIAAPSLGDLRAHPWWRQPMTSAKLDKIIFAIARLPVRQEMFLLERDGEISVYPDDPPMMKGDVCAVLNDNDQLVFFGASFIAGKPPTSRAAAISMLSQVLDAAHASSEMFRKTGKGFSSWDQFLQMGEIPAFESKTAMPPAPGGAIGPPKKK